MITADFHVHSTFCDGESTPEELCERALADGMTALGFSGHSYTAFDSWWCMTPEKTEGYRACVQALRERYAGRLRVLCGIEQDFYAAEPAEGYDYVIGSVHYLFPVPGEWFPVDESAEDLRKAADRWFGGDMAALAAAYYDTAARVVEKTRCGIIGHFDVISKFNAGGALFDETEPRVTAAWQRAADALLRTGALFEVNTGAMASGYRTEPYPSREKRLYLAERGARFLLSSDCHRADRLRFGFAETEALLAAEGITPQQQPDGAAI